uniref:Uncharacterized protein n=1 Tax=Arundo donax TaxID=35708 RepID=A0A0A8ZZG8_ARUDO
MNSQIKGEICVLAFRQCDTEVPHTL